eukprot:2095722-Karenia_brevis.AAC.1
MHTARIVGLVVLLPARRPSRAVSRAAIQPAPTAGVRFTDRSKPIQFQRTVFILRKTGFSTLADLLHSFKDVQLSGEVDLF